MQTDPGVEDEREEDDEGVDDDGEHLQQVLRALRVRVCRRALQLFRAVLSCDKNILEPTLSRIIDIRMLHNRKKSKWGVNVLVEMV